MKILIIIYETIIKNCKYFLNNDSYLTYYFKKIILILKKMIYLHKNNIIIKLILKHTYKNLNEISNSHSFHVLHFSKSQAKLTKIWISSL